MSAKTENLSLTVHADSLRLCLTGPRVAGSRAVCCAIQSLNHQPIRQSIQMNSQLLEPPSTGRRVTLEPVMRRQGAFSNDLPKAEISLGQVHRLIDQTGRTLLYTPGRYFRSLDRPGAQSLLRQARSQVGIRGGVLVGLDLSLQNGGVEELGHEDGGVTGQIILHLNAEHGWEFRTQRPAPRLVWSQAPQPSSSPKVFDNGRPGERCFQYSLVALGQLARRARLEVSDCWAEFGERHALAFLSAVQCPRNGSNG